MASSHEHFRKLSKMGQGSYYVVIPPHLIRELGWKERQKLVVAKSGKGLRIQDWKPSR